jgi:hypothetical protein
MIFLPPCGDPIEDVEKNRLVVIHAMKLRKQFHYLLEGGTEGGTYGI